jgi:hypothetical protein
MNINQAYCKVTKQIQSLEWLRYNADQNWYKDELRKQQYEAENAAIAEKAAKAEAWRVAHEAEQAAKLQAYLKKETPEEYKARKEQQAQRKVKKETPEEYAARTEYMKKKEKLELEAEAQRLFNIGEKKHQDHLDYLARERARAERQAEKDARADAYEANQAYKNSAEGRAEQERKDEKTRIWNTPEAKWKREKVQEEFVLNQKKREKDFFEKSIYQYQNATPFDGNSWNKHVKNNYDSAYRTAESGGIAAVIERKKHEQLFGSNKKYKK